MATDGRDPDAVSRSELYTDLFETLSVHRRGDHADRMAQALLRKDRSEKQLVGLDDDCERAVYYSPDERTLKGYQFDKHGVSGTEFVTRWRLLSDAASWVDAHQDDLDWIHPQFRWVLDLPSETTDWGYQARS